MEGVGGGPIRDARSLEAAGKQLKLEGKVELWNYLGELKSLAETRSLVSKVWRMFGHLEHNAFHRTCNYQMDSFDILGLEKVHEWLGGKYKSHVLVLSGDGGLGKTHLGEALLLQVCPAGFWFVDDPDDFRELDGQIQEEHGILVDEVNLQSFAVNEVKKLFDLEKTRRVKCRHFNGTLPARVPRIYCTNSPEDSFYPRFPSKQDRTGVLRRQLFETIPKDLRKVAGARSAPSQSANSWEQCLAKVCTEALVDHHLAAATQIARDMGVALPSEVKEVAEEIADKVEMRPLERKRFLKQVAGDC